MSRHPEIGNIQLYPNRPLQRRDKNGYVLKFYCPIRRKRIRKNTGTRDRREARRVLRECRERLLNGLYASSDGAITIQHEKAGQSVPETPKGTCSETWESCYDKYRKHQEKHTRVGSMADMVSRLAIAERIFEGFHDDRGRPTPILVRDCMTLVMMEYLQDRLLAGDEGRYDYRASTTVNSLTKTVMAFVRFCATRGWIDSVPGLQMLNIEDAMKGRPITGEEFDRMIEATPRVVGLDSAESWQFALRIIWETGFRVGDLMDFNWSDERHIRPIWTMRANQSSTIAIPSTQKNRKTQQIPMTPGLEQLLEGMPQSQRNGWIVNPLPISYEIQCGTQYLRPTDSDLKALIAAFSNRSIGRACGVTDTTVRKWLHDAGISRECEFQRQTEAISEAEMIGIRSRGECRRTHTAKRAGNQRLTKERVGRVISMIGHEANVVVQKEDEEAKRRLKYASAHDIRRGCALRLINCGVSAETLTVIMRHEDFETTKKHYGATRDVHAAAAEIREKLSPLANSPALMGGLVGGSKETPQLTAEELHKLKALLNSL
jgi:integrase